MNKPKIILFFTFFMLGILAYAQHKKIIHGYIQDADNQEYLSKATVWAIEAKTAVQSNTYGFFSMSVTVPQTIEVRCIGYTTQVIRILPTKDSLITIRLTANVQQLDVVEIKAQIPPHEHNLSGFHQLSAKSIAKIPVLMGESDALKSLQTFPGVQGGKEGTVGLNVRGGTPDQNLILLDGVPVYNINHLFGFLSVFNNDAISTVDFYKGGVPARYGGRLSSVIDVSMREGNKQRFERKITASPIASRFLFEGPIIENKSSFLFSLRRTWLDFFTTPAAWISDSDFKSVLKFYDVNFKINHTLSNKNRLYFSYYTGRDGLNNSVKLGDGSSNFNYNWGNNTFVLRWNHLYSQRLFGNLSLSYTKFNYKLQNEVKDIKNFNSRFESGIRDWTLKYDWDFFVSARHTLRFGLNATAHLFQPEVQQIKSGQTDTSYVPQVAIRSSEFVAYIEDEFKVNNILTGNIGLNSSYYKVGNIQYFNPQPRLSLRLQTGQSSSLKLGYGRFSQYLHLLSNSSLGLPTDLWVAATKRIPPQASQQFSLGYYKNILNDKFSFSVEGYYRSMSNVIEYKEGASFLSGSNKGWEDKIAIGNGAAYGAEFLLQKNIGKLKGRLSYTLSKSDRTFAELNRGVAFPYKYDSRHNIALTLDYDLSKTQSLSANFFFNSGIPLQINKAAYSGTFPHYLIGPIPTFEDNSLYANYYSYFNSIGLISDRNSYRTPAYHRMDINYKTTKPLQNGNRTWTFGIYNVYNRNNPFFIYYDKSSLKQFSLFPFLPSFSYERTF
jgi:TonB-dependent Receptor Plug Domain/CarboxypepD_reg-like domain